MMGAWSGPKTPPVAALAAATQIVERIQAVGLERVHEPHVRHLEGKLWEMRPDARGIEGRALSHGFWQASGDSGGVRKENPKNTASHD